MAMGAATLKDRQEMIALAPIEVQRVQHWRQGQVIVGLTPMASAAVVRNVAVGFRPKTRVPPGQPFGLLCRRANALQQLWFDPLEPAFHVGADPHIHIVFGPVDVAVHTTTGHPILDGDRWNFWQRLLGGKHYRRGDKHGQRPDPCYFHELPQPHLRPTGTLISRNRNIPLGVAPFSQKSYHQRHISGMRKKACRQSKFALMVRAADNSLSCG